MNASYEWLREFVPVSISPQEMSDLFAARCASVDEVVRLRADLAPIVVARVVEAGPHPNSDHLWVTKVDAGGGEILDVVCGAPNVQKGALYPFAAVGVTLPGGLKLEKRKIRGEVSNGMLCSARELGLGEDHAGIMELRVDVAPGTPFLDALSIGDSRLVVDVTPNRPDLLSHIGLARELAAATGQRAKLPYSTAEKTTPLSAHEAKAAGVTVRIVDTEGCSRYLAAIIKGVRVAESPEWLRRRLEAVGARPVNNIVDVTNFILQESGQPLHAFDLDKLGGNAVIVRRAMEGEKIRTLDDVERTLKSSMTVIADASTAHAVGGVMGGAESAVSANTQNILLEIATFDPGRIRATRLALGLSTDASYRFERGVDPELPGVVASRAIKMIIELAGGELADSPVDLCPRVRPETQLNLRLNRASTILGEQIKADEASKLLTSVGFGVGGSPGSGGTALLVSVPSWRVDVVAEIDLVEELARLRGFSSFPDEIRPYRPGTVPTDLTHLEARRLRSLMTGFGFYEARPLPFTKGSDETHVRITNPIADDERYLRGSILETLSGRAEHNLAQAQRVVRLFEVGNVFRKGAGPLPRESVRIGAVMLGARTPPHFTDATPANVDEWDAKALAESISSDLYGKSAVHLVPSSDGKKGLLWSIEVDGKHVGEVRRLSLDAPVWAAPAFGVEILVADVISDAVASPGANAYERSEMSGRAGPGRRYVAIPTLPASAFDLALIVPDDVAAAQIESVLRRVSGDLLEDLSLFDEFRGAGLPAGTRSLAWRLTYRHPERTLRDKEVEGRRQKLLTVLEKELGVRQRSS